MDGDAALYYASEDSASSSGEYVDQRPMMQMEKVRRGSEGYEVRPIDREELLRRYIEEQAQEEGRYHRYVPEPDFDSEEECIPLARTVESWRAETERGTIK